MYMHRECEYTHTHTHTYQKQQQQWQEVVKNEFEVAEKWAKVKSTENLFSQRDKFSQYFGLTLLGSICHSASGSVFELPPFTCSIIVSLAFVLFVCLGCFGFALFAHHRSNTNILHILPEKICGAVAVKIERFSLLSSTLFLCRPLVVYLSVDCLVDHWIRNWDFLRLESSSKKEGAKSAQVRRKTA